MRKLEVLYCFFFHFILFYSYTRAVSKPLGSFNNFMKKEKKNTSLDNVSIQVTQSKLIYFLYVEKPLKFVWLIEAIIFWMIIGVLFSTRASLSHKEISRNISYHREKYFPNGQFFFLNKNFNNNKLVKLYMCCKM